MWRMKHLLTKLSGDHTWVPCGDLETPHDIELFMDSHNESRDHRREKREHKAAQETGAIESGKPDEHHTLEDARNIVESQVGLLGDLKDSEDERMLENPSADDDVAMVDASAGAVVQNRPEQDEHGRLKDKQITSNTEEVAVRDSTAAVKNHDAKIADYIDRADIPEVTIRGPSEALGDIAGASKDSSNAKNADGELEDDNDVTMEFDDEQNDQQGPRRMRTRAQAQADSDITLSRNRSMTPDSSNESYVHPYFLAPISSYPDRDFGLPQHEADETRRLLQSYIQKQEEVCRGAQKVYDGLLRAERLRQTVMRWAKAEGHVGEMENDEDWYDKTEWGLDEDLKKGQDEEEEDAATTAKKTRTRRQ